MNRLEIIRKLEQIPHLNLTDFVPAVPVDSLLKELNQFNNCDYFPYISGNPSKELAEYMANNWRGFCIIDACKEGRHNIDYMTTENNFDKLTFQFDDHGNKLFAPTDVGQQMPKTIEYLYSLIKDPGKTRISRIKANGGNATWHSHRKLADSGDKRFTSKKDYITPVLHIPLVTNDKVHFGVAEQKPTLDNPGTITWQRYAVGEVWLFNSYYYHNVYNTGSTDRDHIMMYTPLDDVDYLKILSNAIENYSGPLLTKELA
jgi:hypothetical protein